MKENDEEIKIAVTGDSWMRRGTGSIESLIRDSFSKANDEVLIAAYSVSDNRDFIKMLEDLLVRGIRVAMIINRFYKQDAGTQKTLKELCKKYKNMLIFNFEPASELEDLHAKLIVIDHSYALVGSANLSGRGFFRNHELMVQLSGKAASEIGFLIDTLRRSPNTSCIKI